MTSPLAASYYADGALQRRARIVENVAVARDTFRLRFECADMAARFLPGQFLMLRLADCNDPLIGRPLALYDVIGSPAGKPTAIDVVYLAGGKLTRRLSQCRAGVEIEVWGPLGNGFAPEAVDELIMVAGGIGYTPFLVVAKEALGLARYGSPQREAPRAVRVTFCYGARSADMLAGVDDFRGLGVDVLLATDDGTAGHHGLVTDVLRQVLSRSSGACRIVCCGPEPMMEAVAEIAAETQVPCQVSLETPMACGIGICFSCVAKVRETDAAQSEWDYKRTCVEGPVFAAEKIVW